MAKHLIVIKSSVKEGEKKAGKKGINELSPLKTCFYCTLESCCHGRRKGTKGEKARFRLLWEIYTVTRNHAYPYAVTFPAVQLLWVLLT